MEKRVLEIREIIVERDFENHKEESKFFGKSQKPSHQKHASMHEASMKHANPTFTKRTKIKVNTLFFSSLKQVGLLGNSKHFNQQLQTGGFGLACKFIEKDSDTGTFWIIL